VELGKVQAQVTILYQAQSALRCCPHGEVHGAEGGQDPPVSESVDEPVIGAGMRVHGKEIVHDDQAAARAETR
jgi:hypothetical protein